VTAKAKNNLRSDNKGWMEKKGHCTNEPPSSSPGEAARPKGGVCNVLEKNIEALVRRRREEDIRREFSEKIADRITAFAGSMACVYVHLVVFGLWIIVNLGWIPGAPRFDPTFVILAMASSVEAIFLSTFVLITQNRMAAAAEKRAELDLQVSLLAEHEITRVIGLVLQIAERLGIDQRDNIEIQELAGDARPEKILDRIEKAENSV
jgi:uncharacterized membrane protein